MDGYTANPTVRAYPIIVNKPIIDTELSTSVFGISKKCRIPTIE